MLTLCALLQASCTTTPQPSQEMRAIWVTRYDYKTERDVRTIIANCASLGINRILFQVRGNASVFYRSDLEPWSERLGGTDPGFDPLQIATQLANSLGIRIEAWINVMPLWKGTRPPKNPAHPYLQHPKWLMVGSDGKPQALNAHYVCANPARADVQAHLAAVAAEIAERYPVDAIHLDYIRAMPPSFPRRIADPWERSVRRC